MKKEKLPSINRNMGGAQHPVPNFPGFNYIRNTPTGYKIFTVLCEGFAVFSGGEFQNLSSEKKLRAVLDTSSDRRSLFGERLSLFLFSSQ